jgi:thiosulfate sulfurtransferase
MLDDGRVAIVDIRDENSFGSGHIPGSRHLDNGSLQRFRDEVDFDTPVIVTCYHGISSQPAAQFIVEQGYEDVYSMDGGFTQWQSTFPQDVAVGHD